MSVIQEENIELSNKVLELGSEVLRLERWIDDLQSGMYINCVYCGHRYPPGTNAVKRKVLYDHIKQCPKHPLSKAEEKIKELEEKIKELKKDAAEDLKVWKAQQLHANSLFSCLEVAEDKIRKLEEKIRILEQAK